MTSISFNQDMIRAIIDGRKTQTRRLCNTPEDYEFEKFTKSLDCVFVNPSDKTEYCLVYPKCKLNDTVCISGVTPEKSYQIKLKITNVKIERLQDITELDAIHEGVELCNSINPIDSISMFRNCAYKDYSGGIGYLTIIQSFKTLWNSIYPEAGKNWESNPWAIVYCFDVINASAEVFNEI